MSLKPTSDIWWKNAVIYCVDVETFYDSDGDGAATCAASPTGSTISAASACRACG